MGFVIKLQEVFADNMTKREERLTRMETACVGLFNIVSASVQAQREWAVRPNQLREAQKQTNERLNTLIDVVE